MLDTGRPSQDDNIVRRWHVLVFVFGRWQTMALSELRLFLQQQLLDLVLAAETLFGVVRRDFFGW